MDALYRLSDEITTTHDPESLLQSIVCEIGEIAQEDDDETLSLSEMWSILTSRLPILSSTPQKNDPWRFGLSLISFLISSPELSNTTLHAVGNASLPLCAGQAFQSMCFLLCCAALQRGDAATVQKRPKRWKSIQLETMFAYHRLQHTTFKDDDDQSLFLDYILPATTHVQEVLLQITSPPLSDDGDMIWEAATIQIVSDWMESASENNFSAMTRLQHWPWHLLNMHDLVGLHAWRTHHEDSLLVNANDDLHASLVRLANENDNQWDFQSSWSDVGVAMLTASLFWTHRPAVWSPRYQWHIFFPYVDVLLVGNEVAVQFGWTLLSGLLDQRLIHMSPITASSITDDTVPDNPSRALQGVANHLVRASATTTTSSIHPPAAATYGILQRLLRVYPPHQQVALVEQLLQRCPFPGLRPKLMDLLRGYGGWDDNNATATVLDLCHRTTIRVVLDTARTNDDDHNLELHLATLGLLEVAPEEIRKEKVYRSQLRKMQVVVRDNLQALQGDDENFRCWNGWGMLNIALERILEKA